MTRKFEHADDSVVVDEITEQWKAASADRDWTSYACKLVTPLYGGGVSAGVVDQAMPVRAAALRGQLRFWWRMACAPLDDPKAMFKAESAIWGGIGAKGPAASRVRVRVRDTSAAVLKPAFRYQPDQRHPGKLRSFPTAEGWAEPYALFSAQGKLDRSRTGFEEVPEELAQAGLSFNVEIALDDQLSEPQRAEVLAALRWWASFGGIGARTRRGLGSVLVDGLEPVCQREVSRRNGQLELRKAGSDPAWAWKESVGRLKAFRQGLGTGRNPPEPGSRSPAGRSLWPEADTLRALSGKADKRHATRLVTVDAFPRAAFGLPVVFHFNTFSDPGDPDDHVLEPADRSRNDKRDRMASPLIVGPYWEGKHWCPMALLLPGWNAAISQPLKLKGKPYGAAHWPADDKQQGEWSAAVRPMRNRGQDPLSAFMHFFTEE
jgi:CRISPR-associated protein Cmr1